jgi:DNA-binding beta-propeller fold protein YncE
VRTFRLILGLGIATLASIGLAQSPSGGPYKVLKVAKVGGDGGFDYVNADTEGRRLYISRSGPNPRVTVFDMDTLAPVGQVANSGGHGAVVDPKVHHGFATTKPVVMFDTNSLTIIKTIEVQGNPDGLLFDPFNERFYILSHIAPNLTVIDAKEGSVVGTIDLGGTTEQGVTDGKGHLYFDVEDKGKVAVVDAKTMTVTGSYDLQGRGGTCAGLGFDVMNHILFAACRDPQNMVMLSSDDGRIITALPIGAGNDGVVFNPRTMEAFGSQPDGTVTVIKENSPTNFVVEQTVQTMIGAHTSAFDPKTGHVFLITAEYGPPPPPPPGAPAGRPARGPMVPDSFSILVVGK